MNTGHRQLGRPGAWSGWPCGGPVGRDDQRRAIYYDGMPEVGCDSGSEQPSQGHGQGHVAVAQACWAGIRSRCRAAICPTASASRSTVSLARTPVQLAAPTEAGRESRCWTDGSYQLRGASRNP